MEFKEAFSLIMELHDQNGDRDWCNRREEARKATSRFSNFDDWFNNLNMRTDISQDEAWECECFSESFKILFALMGKVCVKPPQG